MKKLIVNADDFGYTRSVNLGIIRAFREGIVTSATIMATGAAFDDAVERSKANPSLGLGCHLVLVGGRSVASPKEVSSLADSEGNLPSTLPTLLKKLCSGSIKSEHIAREFRAQISKVLNAGIELSHLDSHKHTHSHPRVMEQVAHLSQELRIPRVRNPFEDIGSLVASAFRNGGASWRRSFIAILAHSAARRFRSIARANHLAWPDHFWGVAETGALRRESILSMISSMGEGIHELMCHPGQYDLELEQSLTRLKKEREQELQALTDPSVRAAIARHQIELVDYRGLN